MTDQVVVVTWTDAREAREALPAGFHLDRRQTVGFLVHHDATVIVLAHDRDDDETDVWYSVIPQASVQDVARFRPDEPVVTISTG